MSMAAGMTTGSLAGYGAYQMSVDEKNVGLSLCKYCFVSMCLLH